MKKVILKFKDKCKIHIGEELYDYVPSDKLYSMLINSLSFIYSKEEMKKIVDAINEKVKISSAFLGLNISRGDINEKIEFLPKPFLLIRKKENTLEDEEKNILNRKKYKGISYVSKNTMSKLSRNYDKGLDYIDYSFDKGMLIGGKYYFEKEELSLPIDKVLEGYLPIEEETIQRNAIDRLSKSSVDTYYNSYKIINYKEEKDIKVIPYFYFYIQDEEDILKEEMVKALELTSLGGKRSLGAGVVEEVYIEEENLLVNEGDLFINLSMIFPKVEEVDKIGKYMLENRNGFIFSKFSTNIKKPTIRMIKEGSVFTGIVEGDIFTYKNIEFNHPVYVYGKAFLYSFGGESYIDR